MASTMSLGELMTAVRQRADMAPAGYAPSLSSTSYFVTEPELISYINQSAFELYDLLIEKYGEDYYVKTPAYTFQTDGTNALYALPSDFYKLLGVDLQLSGSSDSFVTVPPFNFSQRNRFAVPNFQSFYGLTNLRYRIQGSNLWLTPTPAAGQTLKLWYVPKMTTLAQLADTLEGVSGWTEYVIVDAAIKCGQKEESDVQVLMAQKAALAARIESAAANRDIGSPATVSDTQVSDFWWPTGSGSGVM